MTIAHLSRMNQDLDVTDVLMRVRDLVDNAMANTRTGVVTYLPEGHSLRDPMRTVVRGAGDTLLCVAVSVEFVEEFFEALTPVPGAGRRGGPRVLMMISPAEQVVAAVSARAEQFGCEVRVSSAPTRDVVVADGEQLLAGPSACGRDAVATGCPNLIDLLVSTQWSHWATAHTLDWHRRIDRITTRPMAQEIIALLDKGYKDDTAAQRLGVSVRTFRRHVADLLREADVRSRFQFGVRAEQYGLAGGQEWTRTHRKAS